MMEAGNTNCSSEDGVLSTSPSEDPSRHEPITYRNQWVMKGLPAWAHAGLPHGWTKTTHQSGLPMYYHRESRVVVLCKPYQLGNADLKTHKIPVTAIPCMFYDALQEEKYSASGTESISSSSENGSLEADLCQAPEALYFGCLSDEEIRSYCERKFKFGRASIPHVRNLEASCCPLQPRHVCRSLPDVVGNNSDNTSSVSLKRRRPPVSPKAEKSYKLLTSECEQEGESEPVAAQIDNSNYTCQLHMLCTGKVGCCFSNENLPPLSAYPNGRYRILCGFGCQKDSDARQSKSIERGDDETGGSESEKLDENDECMADEEPYSGPPSTVDLVDEDDSQDDRCLNVSDWTDSLDATHDSGDQLVDGDGR